MQERNIAEELHLDKPERLKTCNIKAGTSFYVLKVIAHQTICILLSMNLWYIGKFPSILYCGTEEQKVIHIA
jgi:hypothetical protein